MTHSKETVNNYLERGYQSPLTSHPLNRFIMECTPLILMSHTPIKDIIDNPKGDNDTVDEMYRNPVYFDGFGKFLAKEAALFFEMFMRLDKLQHTFTMLSFFPRRPEKNYLHITEAEYIENIMELYISNNIALQDRVLNFVKFLYDLGVDIEKNDKKERIMEQLQDIGMKSELEKLDYILATIRKSRNLITHSASFYEENLENIFQMEIRYRLARIQPNQERVASRLLKEINRLYKIYKQDKLHDLYTNDAILTKVMVNIFDRLYIKHKEIVAKNKDYVGKNGKLKPRNQKENPIRHESYFINEFNKMLLPDTPK